MYVPVGGVPVQSVQGSHVRIKAAQFQQILDHAKPRLVLRRRGRRKSTFGIGVDGFVFWCKTPEDAIVLPSSALVVEWGA